jgi:hypothetical protein
MKAGQRILRPLTYVVFISYSTPDSYIAHILKEKIEALGTTAYTYEKDLAGGGIIVEEIIRGIDACHEAIVLLSPNTLENPDWVSFEIGIIRGQHKRVTPILNNVHPEDIGPAKDIRAIELNGFDQFLRELRKRVNEKARSRK